MWHHTPIDTKLEHGVALVEPLPSEFMSEFNTHDFQALSIILLWYFLPWKESEPFLH